MNWKPPDTHFEVKRAVVLAPWATLTSEAPKPIEPAYRTDEKLKKLFGIELAKNPNKPYEAAYNVFEGKDNNAALWVSFHWLADPLVIATRDAYTEAAELNDKLLDKNGLAARLLKFADEKDHSGRFYILEGKDRLAALKLYAEVQGYIGKIAIDASTNNFTNNELKLVLVKKEEDKKEEKPVIDIQPEPNNELSDFPLNIKLVKSA